MFENRVLWNIFGSERTKLSGGGRTQHYDEEKLHCSSVARSMGDKKDEMSEAYSTHKI